MPDHAHQINQAVHALRNKKVIAYPTESVYGLGCDPFCSEAVYHLLDIKHRQIEKGLILVASKWEQIEHLIQPIAPPLLAHVMETWPGPVTWAFPASDLVPNWIRGHHTSIALRISAHPTVKELCDAFCGPIVSTSANIAAHAPTRDYRAAKIAFQKKVDVVIDGKVSGLKQPTPIFDAITNEPLRR